MLRLADATRVRLREMETDAVVVRVLDSVDVSLLDADAERVSDEVMELLLLAVPAPTVRVIDGVLETIVVIDAVVLLERDTDGETVFDTDNVEDIVFDCEHRNPTHVLEGVTDIPDIFVAVVVWVRVSVREADEDSVADLVMDGVRETDMDTEGVASMDLDDDRLDPFDIEVDGEGILDIVGDADTLLDCEQRKPTQDADALAENRVPLTVRLLDTLLVMDFVAVSLPDCDLLEPYESDGDVDGVGIRDRVAEAVRLLDCEHRNPTHVLEGVTDIPDIFVAVVVWVRVSVREADEDSVADLVIDGVRETDMDTEGVASMDLDDDRLDPFDIEVDGEGILDIVGDADTLLDCEQRKPTQEADALAENRVADTVRLLDTLLVMDFVGVSLPDCDLLEP